MKKHIILIALLWATFSAKGQYLDSIAHLPINNVPNSTYAEPENILQLNDGNVMFLVHYYGTDQHSQWAAGQEYYKVSRQGALIMDTLFVEDTDLHHFMFTKHPQTSDNIRISILHDSITQESWLQIIPFDDDLVFDYSKEIKVFVSDTNAYCLRDSYVKNSHGDWALHYLIGDGIGDDEHHFVLFGIDGTIKCENAFSNSYHFSNLGIYTESPLEYFYYGEEGDILVCHILDSLFQPINTFTIQETLGMNYIYSFGWQESLVPDNDDLLLFARYIKGNWWEIRKTGVCVVKYDKQTLEQKNIVFFDSEPQIYNPIFILSACPCPSGLLKSLDNGYYLTYSTQDPTTAVGQIAVVKMDIEFNIEWIRYCLEPEGHGRTANCMSLLNDYGVAISGLNWNDNDMFFLILNDEGWTINEMNISVRPYSYYPNPAQDKLHLQYSPDVTPTQIELYDLQGRLVRAQKNGLESLNMSDLPSGTYTMWVKMEDGKVFSDKIVKKS